MEEPGKRSFRGRNYRRRAVEIKPEIPLAPAPAGAPITAKHLGFLHAHCGLSVLEIIGRYPKRLTRASVHFGLSMYFSKQEEFDAELKNELKFNRNDSLKDASMKLPSVGLASLARVDEAFQSFCEAERRKAAREFEATRLVNKPKARPPSKNHPA